MPDRMLQFFEYKHLQERDLEQQRLAAEQQALAQGPAGGPGPQGPGQ
jgi:hypothetical protein